MKMIKNKTQKIIISLFLFLVLFYVIFPPYSAAFGGGTLLEPIKDLICGIGDAVINVVQDILLPGSPKAVDKRSVSELMGDYIRENYEGDSGAGEVLNSIEAGLTDFDNWLSKLPILHSLSKWLNEDYYEEKVISLIVYSPAAIFSNMVPALDVNFINPNVSYTGGKGSYSLETDENGDFVVAYKYEKDKEATTDEEKYKYNTAYQLQSIIATWYSGLRNIAVVGLLSVLVYVAIRIIMSSTAGETAKYKEMLKNWLVAMCILFFMHYMMAFLLKTTELVTDLFTTDSVLTNVNKETDTVVLGDSFMTNTRATAEDAKDSNGEDDLLKEFGYTLIYWILIFYTIIFTWKYLKRFVYLAFLTMISPMVALTYPIDKVNDGKAQAFNMWFKEYTFNVLIQPIHLLLYTILITSAASFAESNMLYTIVAIGFLLEAEKIVKSMFGFNKAEGGILSSAVTGGAIFGTVAGLIKGGVSKLPGGKGGNSSGGKGSSDGSKIHYTRQADSGATKGLAAFGGGNNGTGGLGNTGTSGAIGGVAGTLSGNNKYNSALFNKSSAAYGGVKNRIAGSKPAKSMGKVLGTVGGVKNSIGNSKIVTGAKHFGTGAKNLGKDISGTRIGRTIKGVGKVGGRFINKNNAKKAIKLAAMGVGAATLGTVGLAAGIASDNVGDIGKYAALGAGAGALVGNKSYDVAGSLAGGASGMKDSFQQGYYGDEYVDKVLNPRLDKEWKKDKDVKQHFKMEYGSNYKEKMDEAIALRKAGITDQDDIDTAIKLKEKNQKQGQKLTIEQAANIIQFTKGLNKSDLLNNETRKNLQARAEKMTKDKDKAKRIMDLSDQRFKL